MAKKRIADVLVDTLVAAGVKRVYGLVGDSLNGVTDSIRPRKDLQWVPVRHEGKLYLGSAANSLR
jgi:pyruvate dehydrogenase (quinone)